MISASSKIDAHAQDFAARAGESDAESLTNHSGSSGKIVKLRLTPHQNIARASADLAEQVRDEHKEYVSDE